jgi:hypothetical protein
MTRSKLVGEGAELVGTAWVQMFATAAAYLARAHKSYVSVLHDGHAVTLTGNRWTPAERMDVQRLPSGKYLLYVHMNNGVDRQVITADEGVVSKETLAFLERHRLDMQLPAAQIDS